MAVSPRCKKVLVFGIGGFLLVVGALLGFFWPKISESIKNSQLVLTPDSKNYNMWRETPIPMFLDVFMFNWTNPENVKLGKEKPHFVEVGPYVFKEKHTRVNLQWHENNDTITFQQVREWHFLESESVGTLNDTITNLNVIATVISHSVKSLNLFLRGMVDFYLEGKESLAITKQVGQLVFEGYNDPLLDLAMVLKNISHKIHIPFDKFGWFYTRNMSALYDGTYNMGTGRNNLDELGIIQHWNNATSTPFYPDHCGSVKATTGELYPPRYAHGSISLFASDLCSQLILNETKSMEQHGVHGNKFVALIDQFDNGTAHPEFGCYTAPGSQMPSGVRTVSACRNNAPAFVSFPHFYRADPFYRESVDGMQPEDAKYEFSISIEPTTGIPLEVQAQLQVNLWLEPVKGLKMFENVPKAMMPMFWFRQRTELTPDLAVMVKVLLLLPSVGQYILFGLASIGTLLLLVGIVISVRRGWGDEEDEGPLLVSSTTNLRRPSS